MEGLRPQINIGHTEKPAVTTGTPASLIEARKPKIEAETNIQFIELNNIDLRLLAMDETVFDAIACNMSEKGISAESIYSAL